MRLHMIFNNSCITLLQLCAAFIHLLTFSILNTQHLMCNLCPTSSANVTLLNHKLSYICYQGGATKKDKSTLRWQISICNLMVKQWLNGILGRHLWNWKPRDVFCPPVFGDFWTGRATALLPNFNFLSAAALAKCSSQASCHEGWYRFHWRLEMHPLISLFHIISLLRMQA